MAELNETISSLQDIEANMTFYKHPESAKVVRDAIELLKEQQPKWIPINERLPEEKETVLLSDGYDVSFGYMTTNRNFIFVDDALSKDDLPIKSKKSWGISHWMPLPKIPKDGDGE